MRRDNGTDDMSSGDEDCLFPRGLDYPTPINVSKWPNHLRTKVRDVLYETLRWVTIHDNLYKDPAKGTAEYHLVTEEDWDGHKVAVRLLVVRSTDGYEWAVDTYGGSAHHGPADMDVSQILAQTLECYLEDLGVFGC